MVTAPARRELVLWMQTQGLSERRGLQVVRMSASALRISHGQIATGRCESALSPWPSVTGVTASA